MSKDENGSGGIDMALDLSCNTLLSECVLLKMVGVGRARGVEDANLGTGSHVSLYSNAPEPIIMPLLLVNS